MEPTLAQRKKLLKELAKILKTGNPGDRSEFARGFTACARTFAAAIDDAFSDNPEEAMKRHFE
ncbi:hypothetical protein [Microcystis phage Mae-JY35]